VRTAENGARERRQDCLRQIGGREKQSKEKKEEKEEIGK